MFYKNFYANLTEVEIEKSIRNEGFNPIKFENDPGDNYSPHQHPETKLLAFLDGEMEVKAGEENFSCRKGDKLIIPGNTFHSAIVGPTGCTFFWSEQLV